jgi:hypothetical protein
MPTDAPAYAQAARAVLLRDLATLRREVEAYPDDASLWAARPELPNSAGTLAIHLCGNLRHFLGAIVAGDGYVRDRDAEFRARGLPRAEVVARIGAAEAAVAEALSGRHPLPETFPGPAGGGGMIVRTDEWLFHLAVHLGYHLGQVDYHRRLVTGNPAGVGAIATAELPSARKG